MFTINTVAFKRDLHALIESVGPKDINSDGWSDMFRFSVIEIVRRHHVPVTANKLAEHLVKLVLAHNLQRARKLVDAFDDVVLSKQGEITLRAASLIFRLALLAGFVVFVVVVYQSCAGV